MNRITPLLLPLIVVLLLPLNLDCQQGAQNAGFIEELRQLHHVELLPAYRTGSTVAQVSSYDTTGGNNDGFGGLYSFVRREGDNLVIADLEGPGVVHRIWTPTPTDSMIAFFFDGEPTPRLRLRFIDLFSGEFEPFVKPVVGNEVGGYYCYVPIPYARSVKIVYEGTDIRFHQIQYRKYPEGTEIRSLETPLSAGERLELDRVVEFWSDPGDRPWAEGSVSMVERAFTLKPGAEAELFQSYEGGRVVGIELERDAGAPAWGRGLLIAANWDGSTEPAIRAPIGDFFGYAYGTPAAQSLLVGSASGRDYCYLPMPFDRSASIRLQDVRAEGRPVSGIARVFYSDSPRDPSREGRLYAAWRREIEPAEGEPYLLLHAEGRGHHVGTFLQSQGLEPGMTVFFEGDDITTIDGEMRLHGTGSEDYFNGGWYALLDRWERGVSLPIHGALDYNLPMSRTGGYRFYLADKVSFEQEYNLTIEHGPVGNAVAVDYTSVAFYYGDSPPQNVVEPATVMQTQRGPTEHHFFPQLLSMSLRRGTTIDYSEGRITIEAPESGLVRIDVSDVPPGEYTALLSYERGPEGGKFSLWRRQHQVSDWINSYADSVVLVERAEMGDLFLTDQVRSVTIRTRPSDGHQLFRFHRLILVEKER